MSRRVVNTLATLAGMLLAATAQAQPAQGPATPGAPAAGPAPTAPDGQRAQVEASKLTKIPKQTKFLEAEYPKEAFDKGIETDVILLLDIDDKGKVTQVGIAEPTTPPGMGFDEAALVAAQDFEFEPAEVEGKATAVQITYKYKFRITRREKPAFAPTAPAAPAAPGAPDQPAPPVAPAPAAVKNFTGVLRERGTREVMAGVLVTVFRDLGGDGKPEGYEATSDATGAFAFFDLGPGEWKVNIEAPGYYPYKTTEEIRAGEATNVVYFVERGSYNPFDVTVTATRPRKEVNRTVLSAKEIEKIPGSSGDPLAVVTNLAGVARAPAGSGLIVVRGSAPEDTRFFVDGILIPIVYHFGGLRSVIPVQMLDGIEFYPGNYGAEYGYGTGGVIDMKMKKLRPTQVSGSVDVSLLDAGLFVQAPIGSKLSLAVAARRSYVDSIITAAVPDDAPVGFLTAPRYYDYQLLANYRPTAAHDLRLLHFGSDDKLELLFRSPSDLDTSLTSNRAGASTSFGRTMLTYRYVPREGLENTLKLSSGRDRLFFGFGAIKFEVELYLAEIRESLRHKVAERLTLTYGADFFFARSDWDIRAPRPPKEGEPPRNVDLSDTVSSSSKDFDQWLASAYLEAEWRPLDRLFVVPGIRTDYYHQKRLVSPQPRMVTRLQLAQQWTLKGGVGLYLQYPNQDEPDKEFGNPDLTPELALHYSAGFEWRPREGLTIDATAFYKYLWDQIGRTDRIGMRDGMPRPLIYDNGAYGRVWGSELMIRKELTHKLTGWLAYTLSRAERKDSGATEYRLFDFDQTHILTVLGSYQLPRNWLIGARYRLVSGNPYTPIRGGVYNATSDRYDPISGMVNSARNEPFHQLDIRIDKQWIYDRWRLTLYLDVQNVYDRANPEGLQYNFDFSKSRAQSGLPILTILGIKADF
jgi:TonB family protein